MATRDEPPDPQEVLAAAEAAHLAARHTVPITVGDSPVKRSAGGVPPAKRPAFWQRLVRARAAAGTQVVRPDLTGALPRQRASAASPGRPRRAPLPVAAMVATSLAALLSFAPVALLVALLVMAELGPAGLLLPVRVAAAGWLLAHGVPLHTPDGLIAIAPLAIGILAAWRVARAGVHVTRAIGGRGQRSGRQVLVVALAVAIGYGAIGLVAGLLAGDGDWGASTLRAGLTLAGFGLIAAGYGAMWASGLLTDWAARLPAALPAAARGGVVAAAGVLAVGAALAGVAVAANGGEAADILAAYGTDVAGQAGLTLLCLAYAPNFTVWAAAYLIGPGFAVGTDTMVRSSEVSLGPLPGLPVFAALPDGALPTVGALLLMIPVLAGAIAGVQLVRCRPSAAQLALGVPLSGLVAGAVLGLAAAVAAGPLGHGQLAALGPDPVLIAGFATATVTVGVLVGAMAMVAVARWRRG